MRLTLNPRRVLPVVVALAIIALAARGLLQILRHVTYGGVVRELHAIATPALLLAALLVVVLYGALAAYEAIVARTLAGPVSDRRAMLGALLAAPIGHVVGWGAVSGGAIRYRLYRAVLMRPLDIGKFVLLAAMPYPLGLGVLLGLSLVLQSAAAAAILHISVPLNAGVAESSTVTDDDTKNFALALGQLLVARDPKRTTVNMAKAERNGRVFIDWSQNDRHKTTICAYSLRIAERPAVSTPVTWDEVHEALDSNDAGALAFEAPAVIERVERAGDHYSPALALGQDLPAL